MSLNNSVPQLHDEAASQPQAAIPEYVKLVRFLVQPFLESPDSLSVDCEISSSTSRVWIRVAFEGEDKGRVFGRGGRNVEAIRVVIAAAAAAVGHSVYLDIYGSQTSDREGMVSSEEEGQVTPIKPIEQRPSVSKPVIKPRIRSSLNQELM